MPFCNQHYFMHSNALDVCIYVLKIQFNGPDYVKMKVDYYNLGYSGNPWIIERKNNFIVEKEQYSNWIRIPQEKLSIPRTKSGLPI